LGGTFSKVSGFWAWASVYLGLFPQKVSDNFKGGQLVFPLKDELDGAQTFYN